VNLPPHLQATLDLVTQGKGTDEIAAALRVTERTAYQYVSRLRVRLRAWKAQQERWEADLQALEEKTCLPP
jgi:DNA-binding NarL/FixJ family response regulator